MKLAVEPLEQPTLGLRPDARDGGQPPFARSLAELVCCRHAERSADLDHALRPDPEEAPEPDQLGLHLALELVELRDAPGLDELAEACGDTGADAAQLLHTPGGDELGDRRLRLADRLRSSPIRTRGVVAGVREVQQARERFQLLRDVGVCHAVSLAGWRRS
jgi:hypothetical protein